MNPDIIEKRVLPPTVDELKVAALEFFAGAIPKDPRYIALSDWKDRHLAYEHMEEMAVYELYLVEERINSSKSRIEGYEDVDDFLVRWSKEMKVAYLNEGRQNDDDITRRIRIDTFLIWDRTRNARRTS